MVSLAESLCDVLNKIEFSSVRLASATI